jgi:hypothetical protein
VRDDGAGIPGGEDVSGVGPTATSAHTGPP